MSLAGKDASLKDKICVVTGGGSGIGAAICRSLAAAGAQAVCVVDMNLDSAREVAESLGSGCQGLSMAANCGQEMDLRRVISRAWAELGPIDVFVSNAGIPSNGGIDVPNDEWDRIWRVNSMAHVWAARHLFPRWIEADISGIFVVTASAAGLLTQVGSLPYSVTKAARRQPNPL